jgi:uncharacterized protein
MKKNFFSLLVVAAFSFICLQIPLQVLAGTNDINKTRVQQSASFKEVLEKAEKGDAKAEFTVGFMYAKGEGVAIDKKKAVEWCSRSAEQGYAEAQYNLGILYAKGDGVPKDLRKSVLWYTKAANRGYADAQLNLGLCYVTGEGVAVNKMEAYKWWLKASQQGNKTAQENIDLLCKQTPSVCR